MYIHTTYVYIYIYIYISDGDGAVGLMSDDARNRMNDGEPLPTVFKRTGRRLSAQSALI